MTTIKVYDRFIIMKPRNFRRRRSDKMLKDDLSKKTVPELKQEFKRLRQVHKPSYYDLMNWMAVYSELNFRGVKITY